MTVTADTASGRVEERKKRWTRYPAYKESGVEWLGEVPAHWDVQELKYIASITFSNVDKHKTEGEQPVHLCNYTDVYYNEHITDDLDFMEATASDEEIRRFMLRAGDVIVTKDSESWDDIAVPAYVPSDLDRVLCGYHLALIRPNIEEIDSEYLFRSFEARGLNDQFRVAATGITRYGLGKYWLDNSRFLVPPLDEQRAIAGFLDRETERIDTLIARKERLIELLQEKRTALISHAVTKGLDPDAPMQDSGVEWLAEVPAHWDVRALWTVAELQRGHDLPSDSREEGDVPIVSSAGVSGYHNIAKANGPGVVTGRYGTIGEITYIEEDYWPLNTTLYVRNFRGNHPRFVYYLLSILPFEAHASKSAVPGVDRNDIHPLSVTRPPKSEQIAIAEYLDRETRKTDMLAGKIQGTIEVLREGRTALISAAVTGTIDVRGET